MVCPSCSRLVGVQEEVCPHCGRPQPGLWGFSRTFQNLSQVIGFNQVILGGCVVLYLLTLAYDPSGIRMSGMLSMLQPSGESMYLFGASGAVPVFGYGRWWTVLSASWLHGGLLHILFNMLWVRQLAPATSQLYGPGRMMLIYLGGGAAGFVLSSVAGAYLGFLPPFLRGASLTIGASASIFGLLGALVLYGRRGGGTAVGQQAWTWALILGLFGFMMPGVEHCFGGPGPSWVNYLDEIDRWIETGVAPDQVTAAWLNEQRRPDGTRPVCAYPGWVKYSGTGDSRDASSFTCEYE